MPRKLKVLSGREIVKILVRYGFTVTRTVGSHARLTLRTELKEDAHITVPLHNELKKGTLKGIISELEKYVSKTDLNLDFYTS